MEEITVFNTDAYRTAYGEKEGRYLLISTEDETELLSIRTGAIGTHSPVAIRLEQQYLKGFLQFSGWDTTVFMLSGIPDPEDMKRVKRFPMFGLNRQHLKDAGLQDEYIALLTDDDMQRISTHAGELLLADGKFADTIKFAAWNLILGTKLDKAEETDSQYRPGETSSE